ncbi:MAG: lipopolysaccharide biosynthesis protein [Pseudoflavonifractor sp.]|nr:lipopolysaccharide biosynthesis protein [Pseudoflavonifractor sp.]
MAGIRSLVKDTAIYGVSSIVGRFLNWLLVPLYTAVFLPGEYGIVTYLYAIVAIGLIVLTYGMETAFFRFANHEDVKNPAEVYSTTLIAVGTTSTLFFALLWIFLDPIAGALRCADHPSYVWMLGLTLAIDAYSCIPFSYLRYKERTMRFATLKLINIGLNIGLNLFFLLLCPWLWEHDPGLIAWFYDPSWGIGYIFLANLISSLVTLGLLTPATRGVRPVFNRALFHRMFIYAYPLLIFGLAGIMNQNLDKIFLPYLFPTKDIAMQQLGIYGACGKIAVVMMMFTQAFRFAYEPFIFAQSRSRGENKTQAYRDAMKYFIIFSFFIFLAVMYYMPVIKHFINAKYFSGLKVVPIIMMADICFGVFFNLSVWYKLTDKTIWGTWFSLTGLAIVVVVNFVGVPVYGYVACAWAALACYGTMMVMSYLVGRAKHPMGYDVANAAFYLVAAMVLYGLGMLIDTGHDLIDLPLRTLLLLAYVLIVIKKEQIHNQEIKIWLNKFSHRSRPI